MQPNHPEPRQQGVMLLEALIGILIFSVGILAMIAMHALAIGYTADAKYRSDASFLASELIGQIWVDLPNVGNYAYPGGSSPAVGPWIAKVNSSLPGSGGANAPTVVVDPATGQVDITIRWQPPSADGVRNFRAIARVSNP
jgi:type IV pilus assembly protein PilV